MRQTNQTITGFLLIDRIGSCAKTAGLLALMIFGMMGTSYAQGHDHEDTLIALPKNAFSLALLQNTATQFKLEITNNSGDTIHPFFFELFAIGFDMTDDCILQQSVNNLNLDTNIEKLWGPQFVSLGIGALFPSEKYATTFGTTASQNSESMIKVRIFGTVNGQNVIWVGFLKK